MDKSCYFKGSSIFEGICLKNDSIAKERCGVALKQGDVNSKELSCILVDSQPTGVGKFIISYHDEITDSLALVCHTSIIIRLKAFLCVSGIQFQVVSYQRLKK